MPELPETFLKAIELPLRDMMYMTGVSEMGIMPVGDPVPLEEGEV